MTPEEIVPRVKLAKEFGVSPRTICRWETQKLPGFDRPIKINGRTYHSRARTEAAKVLGDAFLARPLDVEA